VRPGTLVAIIVILVALIAFGLFLFTDGNGRPEPGRPQPTSVAP
jgi:hypothetical protein